MKMSNILADLYGGNKIDSENISIHSAFICLLHLANEKSKNSFINIIYFIDLILDAEDETDLEIRKAFTEEGLM